MRVDMHLHSLVSDGELDPVAMLGQAAGWGITHLSIADHDSLGAYIWNQGAIFAEARRLGLDLIVGIELDADLDGTEVHLLGYDVQLDAANSGAAGLATHLRAVREARFERARREIAIVNSLLGEQAIREEQIFVPGRETLMKPHFIHPLLERGLFPDYPEANAWYKKNVRSGVVVPKPTFAQALSLLRGAGAWPVLAHPGFYMKDGLDVLGRLPALVAQGLEGVEVHYPYHTCSPRQFSAEDEAAVRAALAERAAALGLRMTRGSDGHTRGDLERVYAALPSASSFW